jgi:hypothetical protein
MLKKTSKIIFALFAVIFITLAFQSNVLAIKQKMRLDYPYLLGSYGNKTPDWYYGMYEYNKETKPTDITENWYNQPERYSGIYDPTDTTNDWFYDYYDKPAVIGLFEG